MDRSHTANLIDWILEILWTREWNFHDDKQTPAYQTLDAVLLA
jgi:hypothetical protein